MDKTSISTSIIKNLTELVISSFVAFLFIKFTPLRNLSKELLNTISTLIVLFSYLALVFIVKTKFVQGILKKGGKIYRNCLDFLNKSPVVVSKFTVEERSAEKYRTAMEEQIKKSKRIYIRLLSGHTMYYDERETFILEALKDLTGKELETKDIKIQLMDRNVDSFNERAVKFVALLEEKKSPQRISYDEYLRRCQKIESEIVDAFGKEIVKFYRRKYLWRLHIFDDVIFISAYSDEPCLVEGHLSPAYSFHKEYDPSLFNAFLSEFNSLYKKS